MSGCGINNLVYTTNSIMPCQHSIKTSKKKKKKKKQWTLCWCWQQSCYQWPLLLSLSKFYFTIDQETWFQNPHAKAKALKFNHLQTVETPRLGFPHWNPQLYPICKSWAKPRFKLTHNPNWIYVFIIHMRKIRKIKKIVPWIMKIGKKEKKN